MFKPALFVSALLMACNLSAQDTAQYNYPETTSWDNDTVKTKNGDVLPEITLNAHREKTAVSVGKAGISPMDLPQATAVISGAVIEAQQINTMSDLLKNTNGVYIMGTTGGYQEEIASRGSSMGSSNTFKNGVRYFNGMNIETSGLERAEVLKGSAAILYGNVTAGGVLNLVTKKPRFDFGGEVGFRSGSFNEYKPTFDVYGSLDQKKTVAYRVNAAYVNAQSFRNEVQAERYYFNPSFLAKLGKNTELLVEGDYLNSTATPDFGAGIVNYEIVDIPRERFLGVSWGYYDAQQLTTTATLTHELSDRWNLTFINAIRYYDTDLFSNTRPNASGGTVSATGNWNRNLQRSQVKDNYFLQQLDLKGEFATGKIKHQLLAGADSERYKTYTTAYLGFSNSNLFYGNPAHPEGIPYYDTVNIFEDYDPSNEVAINSLNRNTLTTVPVSRFGIYVQDLVSFSKHVKLLAGIRYSYQDTETLIRRYTTNTDDAPLNAYDDAFSPRIGLIIQPTENQSVFATYSNSFQVNTGTDINGNALEPSIIDQYEVGIKNKFFGEKLFANVTVYQITNSNLAQISLENGNTNSNIKELAGETRSQGVELDLSANPMAGLTIIAGYSFNETKYIKSNTFVEGSELRYNPKHTANLSANYRFEAGKFKGLSFGVINTYFGDRFAGRSTTAANPNYKLIPLDGYFQMDATLAYKWKDFTLQTKLANIFNELNYNIHDDNSLNPIAPRNYSAAINYTF
ncbi:Iron complex outermembrane receptor protein [Flavobacterium longum]|uniref:TonB-dependent siderophore receptor n=1 Tax=Flavobacterium longum TaxID=1299340 RepID=UPI0039EAF327